jgi:hypothetical protein
LAAQGGANKELAAVAAQLPGTDACKADDKLSSMPAMKTEFFQLFGEANWTKWKSYSADCGPITRLDDKALGPVLIITKAELYREANTGKYAALVTLLAPFYKCATQLAVHRNCPAGSTFCSAIFQCN